MPAALASFPWKLVPLKKGREAKLKRYPVKTISYQPNALWIPFSKGMTKVLGAK